MNEIDCKKLFDYIHAIYQTIGDQVHWQAVLHGISETVNSGKGIIYSKNNETGHIDILDSYDAKSYKFSIKSLGDYIGGVYLLDPWTDFEKMAKLGELCIFDEHIPFIELEKTKYYKQWLKPQNISAGLSIQLFRAEKFRIVLNILYDEKPGSSAVKQLHKNLELLTPHMTQAMSLWMSSVGISETSSFNRRADYLRQRYKLSKREIEVATALVRLSTMRHVATSLFISEETVKSHIKSVKRKMGIKTSHEMMLRLFSVTDSGIGSPEQL
jgi:DNA-binding CsgD family transcriptional regulator